MTVQITIVANNYPTVAAEGANMQECLDKANCLAVGIGQQVDCFDEQDRHVAKVAPTGQDITAWAKKAFCL